MIQYYTWLPLTFALLIFVEFQKRFRRPKVLVTWGVIGLIQLIVYYLHKDAASVQAYTGNYLEGLKALPATLMVIVAMNAINQKLFGDYFISASRYPSANSEDPVDLRKLRGADYVFSFSGFMLILVLTIVTP